MLAPASNNVISGQLKRLKGHILLRLTTPSFIAGYLAIALCLGIAIAASTATYIQKESVSGWVVPSGGLIRVTAKNGGIVEQVNVHEGDECTPGQSLANLNLETDTVGGASGTLLEDVATRQMSASDDDLQSKISKIDSDTDRLQAQVRSLQEQKAESQQRLSLATQQQTIAAENVTRLSVMNERGFVSKRDLEAATNANLSALQNISNARAADINIQQQIDDIKTQIGQRRILLAQAKSQASIARLTYKSQVVQIETSTKYTVTSPIKGRVLAILTTNGQSLTAGAPVAILMPKDSRLQAEVFIPSRAIGFIRKGQQVSLEYQAFAAQKFGAANGRILDVSKTIFMPGDIVAPGIQFQEPVFRARVELERQYISAYGVKMPIQPGMLVSAKVAIRRQSLMGLLFDPIYALGHRQ